jgi:GNAT superfamily N-acetyltransferase
MIIREFRPADAEAAAEVMHAAVPYRVITPQTVAWQVANAPAAQRYRLFVAEAAGQVIGAAATGVFFETSTPGRAFTNLTVHPAHRGRGAGTALLAAAEEYLAGLGASTVYGSVLDDEPSLAFAARHGYRRGHSNLFQRLDLAVTPLPPLPAFPAGVELCTAADLADNPRPLYEADAESVLDEPGEVTSDNTSYDGWLQLYWNRPDLDRDLTSLAIVDGVVAAFTVARTDGRSRYWSGMTGTRRAFRGRGLAKLVKNDSLHRARAAGYVDAFTGNDTGNAAMLAINRWFGYRPCVTAWRCVRDLPR